jgi:hypothetical protein
MPISKEMIADNGITVSYHKATNLSVDLVNNVATVTVNSYANEQAAINNLPTAWQWRVNVPVDSLAGDSPTLLGEVEQALVADGAAFEGGIPSIDGTVSLEIVKARKNSEITAARLKADADHFIYSYTDSDGNAISKDIRTGNKDMIDLLTTNSYITLFGDFDEDWPGGWKAIDNTYVQIATLDQWKDFFKCMYKTGIANFKKSQLLKAQIEAATTVEEVAAINW